MMRMAWSLPAHAILLTAASSATLKVPENETVTKKAMKSTGNGWRQETGKHEENVVVHSTSILYDRL
jgi:hypothetical protein